MYNIPSIELKYLGRKIQTRRKALGLTQEQLAEKLNCSLTHLCRIEGGCKPGMDALLRICRVLGCSLDELLGLYPPDNQVIQRIISRVQTRPEREQRIALLLIDYLFMALDRLNDPEDPLSFPSSPEEHSEEYTTTTEALSAENTAAGSPANESAAPFQESFSPEIPAAEPATPENLLES